MYVTVKHYPTSKPMSYFAVEPVKTGETFEPNYALLRKVKFNILNQDFVKHQKQGKTILINEMGGWCTLATGMEIVELAAK